MPVAPAPTECLAWDDWVAAVSALSVEALDEDALFVWARRLRVDGGLLAPHVRFDPEGYHRSVLLRTPLFEAVVLCWEPGQGTMVHDHGRSFGVSHIHEGALAVTHHAVVSGSAASGQAALQPTAEAWVPAGAWMLDRVGTIHALHNPAELGRRCVSLHIYAGPLDKMHRYDLDSGTVTVKLMGPDPDPEGG